MNADELDDLLAPMDRPADRQLRDTLLAQTAKIVRARKGRSRWLIGFAFAGCYAAGIFTMWLMRSSPVELPPRIVEVIRIERVPAESAPPVPLQMSAAELELQAEAIQDGQSYRRFRQAGDEYLLVEKNYEAALRCYRNYLDLAPESEQLVSAQLDTWLLINLKTARHQRENHANSDG